MAIRTAIGGAPARDKRVLVAEDERHHARLLQVNLEKAGCHVVCVFDGQAALDRLAAEEFDLLLLDVMMPKLDGFEVLKRLRQDPATENLPVFMLTARRQDADVFSGYHYGADIYLVKPVNILELLKTIEQI